MPEPMHGACILIVDDEPQIRRVLRNALTGAGASVLEASSGKDAIDCAAAQRPALMILDLGLPDITGLSVCIEVRRWSGAPIVVLSARHSEAEKVAMLDAGADDYVAKPFSTSELLARARAQLRRAASSSSPADIARINVDDLQIDLAARLASRSGEALHLTPIEWDLLRVFVKYAGRTLTHQQIFREVWRNPVGDAQAYLRVHIANLRRKIENDPVRPKLIVTEPGVGYRFKAIE
jgi:two-component system, OmpR family, KDP operon response regulator KdpE